MPSDAFLVFPKPSQTGGIQPAGESVDKAFPNAIVLTDFHLGMENLTTIGSATGGATTGKARFAELTIGKAVDKATGSLVLACCQGAHFPEAVVSVRKPSATGLPLVYLVYRFSMVFCTKVEWAGPGDVGPDERVTLVYGGLQVSYQQTDPTGKLLPALTTSWNQVTNTPQFP